MYAARRLVSLSSALALAAVLVFAAYWFGARNASDAIHTTGERQLQIIALDLEAVLDRFDTLPYSVAHLPLASQLLATPDKPALQTELNATLQDLAQQAKVAAIHLMDNKGYVRKGHPLLNTPSVKGRALLPYGLASVRLPDKILFLMAPLMGLPQGVRLPLAIECDDLNLLKSVAMDTDTVLACADAGAQEEVAGGLRTRGSCHSKGVATRQWRSTQWTSWHYWGYSRPSNHSE